MNHLRARRNLKPNAISLRLVLLAFALLVAQPAHWMTCCLATMPDLHLPVSLGRAVDGQETCEPTPNSNSISHEQADREAATHSASEAGVHNDEFVITPHCVRAEHHHAPCCSDCKAPALTQRTERTNSGASLLVSSDAVSVPIFRLDVLEGLCTRAGPAVLLFDSPHLESFLTSRGPPLST